MSNFDFTLRPETQSAVNSDQRKLALSAQRAAFAAMSPTQKTEFIAKFELLRTAAIAHRARMAQASTQAAIQKAQSRT